MRERCVDFMVAHRDDFEPFIAVAWWQSGLFWSAGARQDEGLWLGFRLFRPASELSDHR